MTQNTDKFLKITIPLGDSNWLGYETEGVWALKEEPGNLMKLANVPFFAWGLSYGDIVSVVIKEGDIFVDAVVKKSGHETYRVIAWEGKDLEIKKVLMELNSINATYESMAISDITMFAIDAPNGIVGGLVRQKLKEASDLGILDYEEADIPKI